MDSPKGPLRRSTWSAKLKSDSNAGTRSFNDPGSDRTSSRMANVASWMNRDSMGCCRSLL
jgi:hypothetical protein